MPHIVVSNICRSNTLGYQGEIGQGAVAEARHSKLLLYGRVVNEKAYRLKANITVVKRTTTAELRDICLHTGVCVLREWAERRANGTLGEPSVRFDTIYDPYAWHKRQSTTVSITLRVDTMSTGSPTTSGHGEEGQSENSLVVWLLSLLGRVLISLKRA